MATAFNLTAQLNLRGPNNVNKIVADIKKQLAGITANVNMKLDPTVAKNVKALDSSLKSLNATLTKTGASASSAASAISAFGKSVSSVNIKTIPTQINATVASMNKLNKSSTAIGSTLNQSATEMQEFGKQAGLAIRRFAAFTAVTGVIYSLTNSINQGIQAYIEYDKELVRLQQVTGKTAAGLKTLQQSISQLAVGLGVSSKELTTVSVTLAQAGLSARDTERALKALALSSLAPSFDDMNETVEGSIALMRQFGISAGQLEQALGSINAVAAAFAVEADDLITAIQRTGGVFATASKGVSEGTDALNEFISVFTSVRATTRESAETIATGLRTIFTRIQRGGTIDALKEFGVNLTDAEGKFVGAYKAVQLLSEGLSKLDPRDIKFSRIVEELGGFRQIGKVIPLIQQFAVAQDALKIAQGGQASLAKDAATAQLSLANQIQKVREEFFALFREIGQSKGFQSLVSGVLTLTRGLIKLADVSKSLLPALSVIAAFKGASALTQFASGFSQGFRPGGGKNDKDRPRFRNGGPVRYFSAGGDVPGSGGADNVPAMLTPGEFVINKKAASKIGRRTLRKINRYARGGQAIRAGISDIDVTEVEDGDTFTASVTPKAEPFAAKFRLWGYDAYETGNKRSRITPTRLSQIKKYNTRSGALTEIDESENPIVIPAYTRVKQGATAQKAAEEGKKTLESKLKNINKSQMVDKINTTLDTEGGFGRYVADLGKLLPDELTTGRYTSKNLGGRIQRFAAGGTAQRRVGYIDYDVIANDANKAVVEKGMKQTGSSGPRIYSDYLTDLAVKARKSSSLQKLRAIYGVAGAGKTTLARGQGTDNASLRQTERFPILSPEDIERATEIIVLSSSVSKKKLDEMFSATDRTYTLSSTTKAEKDRIRNQRASRDSTGVGLEGRKAGSTTNVANDTAVGEALLTDALGQKSVVLGRNEKGGLRRKSGSELVEIIKKKIGFTWGGFAPMTAGHESIMDAAAAKGISPEDFIYLVGSNEAIKAGDPSSYRTAVFDQDVRVMLAKAGAGARGAKVLPKPKDFEVPQAFDISEGDQRKVLIPSKGSRTFVADKTADQTSKYKEAGYEVSNLERTGGISGTMVRDLIMSGDMAKLQQVLSPGVYDLISNNIGRLQNRANALPSIIQQVQEMQAPALADIEQQIKALGISRIDNKKLASDPEYAAQVEVLKELRDRRDKIKASGSFEPYRLLKEMATKDPSKYGLDLTTGAASARPFRTASSQAQRAAIGGFIRKFADAGMVGEAGKPLSRSEILKVLGAGEAGALVGLSGPEVYTLLGLRNPDSAQKAQREAIEKEFIKKRNRKAGAAKGLSTRLQNKGFEFGAAGMFGNAFSPVNEAIESDRLSSAPTVRIVSGVMKKEVAEKLDQLFAGGIDNLTTQAAQAILSGYGESANIESAMDNYNADSTIQGALLEKVIQKLGGPGAVRGKGFDFPEGLKTAAKYFGLPGDIPTDVKRTLSGPSTIKDNIVTYLKNVQGYNSGGRVSLDDIRAKIAKQYPDYKFRINPKTSGFGYRMLARPAADDAPDSLLSFDLISRLSDAPSMAEKLINRLKEQQANKKFAGGGPVSVYHGSNTGTNDSVLESFKKEGARSDIAQGYGQGAGLYVWSDKDSAKRQAQMRVKAGLGSFAVVKGDTAGKPMVLTFKEMLDPATWDLDYEMNKGPVVQWLVNNYDKIKDKVAPKLTADERLTGIKEVGKKDTSQGIMSDSIRVQSSDGTRKTIYAGTDSDIREGELVGQIMNRLQASDPETVASFEKQFFNSPALASGDWDRLALKYVGSSPLKPTNIETFATGGLLSRFADGGSVPALLTPGEAVIPPDMAKKIGYSKLQRMNHADKNGMGRYATGGKVGIVPGTGNTDSFGPVPLPVGSFVIRKKATEALGFNRGGAVQRFATGGSPDISSMIMGWLSSDMTAATKPKMASRPDVVSRATVVASDDSTKALDNLVKALNDLGLSAASSAEILRKGGDVSYKTIEKALVKDIERLRISGASIDSIVAAETTLANIRKKSKDDVTKQKSLQGMSNARNAAGVKILGGQTVGGLMGGTGAGQQAIETQAQMLADARIKAKGGKVTEKQRASIMESSYVDAASRVTGIKKKDFKTAGISGGDIQKYISESMRDRKTLAQMDKQLIALKVDELKNSASYKSASVAEQQKLLAEVKKAAQDEISTRREIINDLAAQKGEKGVGAAGMFDFKNSPILKQLKDFAKSPGRVFGAASTAAGLVAGSSDMIAKNMYNMSTTEGQGKAAKTGAALQSSGTILSTGLAAASQMAAIPVVGPYVAGLTAVGTAALAAADYFYDFTGSQKAAAQEFERSLRAKEIGESLDGLDREFQNFQKEVTNLDLQSALQKAVGRASAAQIGDNFAERDIAKADFALKNRTWSDIFTGNFKGSAQMDAPTQNAMDSEMSQKMSVVADRAMALYEAQINQGKSIEDIVNQVRSGDESAVYAGASVAFSANPKLWAEVERQVKASGDASAENRTKIVREIAVRELANNKQLQAAQKAKELADAMEAANRAGRKLADNFKSLSDTIDQAINRVQQESEIRQAQTNSLVEASRGNAKFDPAAVNNQNIGVLTNPKAYRNDPKRFDAAISAGTAGLSPEVAQKLAGGTRLEATLPDIMRNAVSNELKGNASLDLEGAADAAKKRGLEAIRASGLSAEDQQLAETKLNASIDSRKKAVSDNNSGETVQKQVDIFADSISDLGSEMASIFGNAGQQLDKIIRERQNIYNTFAKNLESAADAARKARDSFNKAKDIRYNAKMDLREAQTGVRESYDEAKAKFDADIKGLTGGATDPQAIGQNISGLQNQLEQQMKRRDAVASDPTLSSDQKDTAMMQMEKDINATNNALNDNREALDKMANSAELAQKALDEVKNVKGLQQDRENFVNQLLTNTPEEADKLNQTFIRLQRNLSGGLNNAGNQRDAQNAFRDTLRRTGNVREATRAGNTVLADQRKQTLQLMQDPGFRGMMTLNMKNQGMNDEQIDQSFRYQEGALMQQMARESGMINNPMVQQALAAKQNPNADPAMKKAADQFLQATGLQAKATEEQGRLELANVQRILATATEDLRTSVDTLNDTINSAIGSGGEGEKVPGLGGDKVALNLGASTLGVRTAANGGLIYASLGKLIDFKPKGTDTVPAMLTPGEFVVNAKATSQHLPLLKAINSGDTIASPTGMRKGGMVYLAEGGPVKPEELQQLEQARTDAQQTSWMMNEAVGAPANEVVDRSARSWTESNVGYGRWQNMTEEQRQAEVDKNKPVFQEKWNTYEENRRTAQDTSAKQMGYDRAQDDPNSGIVGTNFFYGEKRRSEEAFAKAQAKYDAAKAQSEETPATQPSGAELAQQATDKAKTEQAARQSQQSPVTATQQYSKPIGPELPPQSAVAAGSTNAILADVNAGKAPADIAAKYSGSNVPKNPEMTDAQMYAQKAASAGPQSMADFPRPRNAGEVAAYREGLARGMTIQEIQYEKQQAYLSRFNPETRARMMGSMGSRLNAPSTRQVFSQMAAEAQAKAAQGADPYANQRSDVYNMQRLEELSGQGVDGKPLQASDIAAARQAVSSSQPQVSASVGSGDNKALLPNTMGDQKSRYEYLEQKRQAGRFSLQSSLSDDERKEWQELRRGRELGATPTREDNARRLALMGIAPEDRTPAQQEEYLRLRYQSDSYRASKGQGKTISGATTGESFASFKTRQEQEKYDRDDSRYAALTRGGTDREYNEYDQKFLDRYKKQQADRRVAALSTMADREESFGSTLESAQAGAEANKAALDTAKANAQAYRESDRFKADQAALTQIQSQRQEVEIDGRIASVIADSEKQGQKLDPSQIEEFGGALAASQAGFKDLSSAEQKKLAAYYEQRVSREVGKSGEDREKDQASRADRLKNLADSQNKLNQEIQQREFGSVPGSDSFASDANIGKIRDQARAYSDAANQLSRIKNIDNSKEIEAYRKRAEELDAQASSLSVGGYSKESTDSALSQVKSAATGFQGSAEQLTRASVDRAMSDTDLAKFEADKSARQQAEQARLEQERAAEAARIAAQEQAAAQARAQVQAAADAEQKRKDSMWVNSSNPLVSGIGYLVGAGEAGGRIVRGGLYAGIGNLASAASGLVGNNTEEAERSRKLDAQIKENRAKMAERGILIESTATAEQQQAALAQGNAAIDAQTKKMETASIDAFKGVVDEGAAAGYTDMKSAGTLLFDPGNYQESAVGQFVDKQTKELENMGMRGLAAINNAAGYASAGASEGIASIVTGGGSLGATGRLTGITAARSGINSAIKTVGRVTGITDTVTALGGVTRQAGSLLGRGARKAASVIGDTSFGRGVRTVTNAVGDTVSTFNPLKSRTQRDFIRRNMDDAYGVGDNAATARYNRLTGGDPTKASSVLQSRAQRLDSLKKARASGVKDSAISSRVSDRRAMRWLDDVEAQRASDNVAYNNYQAAQARKNDPLRQARREQMRADGLARQKRVQRGLKRQEQFAAMTPEQRAFERAQRRGLDRGVDIGRPAREKAKIRAAEEKWLTKEIAKEEKKNQGLFKRYSYGKGPDAAAQKAADRLRRRAASRGVDADNANQYTIDFATTVSDTGQIVRGRTGAGRIDDIVEQRQNAIRDKEVLDWLRGTKATPMSPAKTASRTVSDMRNSLAKRGMVDNLDDDTIRRIYEDAQLRSRQGGARETWIKDRLQIEQTRLRRGSDLPKAPPPSVAPSQSSKVLSAVGNQPKTASQVAAAVKEATSTPTVAITRESLERNAQRLGNRQRAIASGVDPQTGLKPGAKAPQPPKPKAPATKTPAIKGNAAVVDRVQQAQSQLKDRLAQFASSEDAAKRLQDSNAFDIDSVLVDAKMQKRGASGGLESTNALGRYWAGDKGKRMMQLKSGDIGADVIEHELGHAFQHNTGKAGSMSRNGGKLTPLEQDLMGQYGTEIKQFLNNPDGYNALRNNVKGDVSTLYPAKSILDKPVELFTSLVQASRSGAFNSNPQAVEMLKKLMKFHGYADGGIVYANNGALISARPRGTDTVPAMLSPGEFVVKRTEAQKHMPLLEAINSGSYSRGGLVNYMANGGLVIPHYLKEGSKSPVPAPAPATGGVSSNVGVDVSGLTSLVAGLQKTVNDLGASIPSMAQVAETINGAVGTFVSSGAQVGDIINNAINPVVQGLREVNIPDQITVAGTVDSRHTFNGAEAANQVLSTMGSAMEQQANQKIGQFAGAINRGIGNLGEGALGPDTGQIMGQIGGTTYA